MIKYSIVFGSLLFLISACGGDAENSENSKEEEAKYETMENELDSLPQKKVEKVDKAKISYPSSREMTISKEGMEEKITAELYRSPQNFPLKFHTYVPNGIEVKTYDAGEGNTVQFNRNEAVLKLQILPKKLNTKSKAMYIAEQTVKSEGEAVATSSGFELKDTKKYVARSLVEVRNGQYYIWSMKYPIEYADGFGSEIHFIQENLVWNN